MASAIKILNIIFVVAILLWVFSWSKRHEFPPIDRILPETYLAPVQTPTDNLPLSPERKDGKFQYDVQPLFDYELTGLVVSKHLSEEDIGMRDHAAHGDFLNSMDLCVVWGENISSGVYRKMTFHNDDWSCQPAFKRNTVREDWVKYQGTALSNNHVLSGNFNADEVLAAIRPGDQIRIKGKLVKYRRADKDGPYRSSSVVREDTGNGACEIIYVTSARILKPANTGWRILFDILKFIVPALGLILAFHYMRIRDVLTELLGTTAPSKS
jgi:hypothetical protein